MNSIKVVRASADACAPYGLWTCLPALGRCAGDGWECWMTETVCMNQPAQAALCYSGGSTPFVLEELRRNTESETLLLCGNKPMVVPLALGDTVLGHPAAFLLEPGELLLLPPGVWYDVCRGVEGSIYYYSLSLEKRLERRALEDEAVQIVL